jgi:hypothetical protein
VSYTNGKLPTYLMVTVLLGTAAAGAKAITDTGDLKRRLEVLESSTRRDDLDKGLIQVDLAYLKAGTAQIQADLTRQREALDRIEEKVRTAEKKIDQILGREASGN